MGPAFVLYLHDFNNQILSGREADKCFFYFFSCSVSSEILACIL